MIPTSDTAVHPARAARKLDKTESLAALVRVRQAGTRAVDWPLNPTPNQAGAALRHYARSIAAPEPSVPRAAQAGETELGDWSITPSRSRRRPGRLRRLLLGTTATALAVVGSGCSSPAPSGGLADLETIAKHCAGAPRMSLIASDESDTSRGATSQPVRMRVIRDEVTRSAVCGGHARVTVFSGSVVGQVVFDGDLGTAGATETSRLRKVPKLVDQTMFSA